MSLNKELYHEIGNITFLSKDGLLHLKKHERQALISGGFSLITGVVMFYTQANFILILLAVCVFFLFAFLASVASSLKISRGYVIRLEEDNFKIIKRSKSNIVSYDLKVRAFKGKHEEWFCCASFSDQDKAENLKKYHLSKLIEEEVSH
jgi:hypothetical protein